MLVHSDPTDMGLNQHRRGLPPWCTESTIQTTLNLPIQYSPLSPNCPARSPIMPTRIIILLNHIGLPSLQKGPYRERIPTTRLLLIAYPTKHSILSLSFFHRGNQSGLVRVLLVQLGFHQTPTLKCTVMA
jgi:hypothetical protein